MSLIGRQRLDEHRESDLVRRVERVRRVRARDRQRRHRSHDAWPWPRGPTCRGCAGQVRGPAAQAERGVRGGHDPKDTRSSEASAPGISTSYRAARHRALERVEERLRRGQRVGDDQSSPTERDRCAGARRAGAVAATVTSKPSVAKPSGDGDHRSRLAVGNQYPPSAHARARMYRQRAPPSTGSAGRRRPRLGIEMLRTLLTHADDDPQVAKLAETGAARSCRSRCGRTCSPRCSTAIRRRP